jgi:hypothetical protein
MRKNFAFGGWTTGHWARSGRFMRTALGIGKFTPDGVTRPISSGANGGFGLGGILAFHGRLFGGSPESIPPLAWRGRGSSRGRLRGPGFWLNRHLFLFQRYWNRATSNLTGILDDGEGGGAREPDFIGLTTSVSGDRDDRELVGADIPESTIRLQSDGYIHCFRRHTSQSTVFF